MILMKSHFKLDNFFHKVKKIRIQKLYSKFFINNVWNELKSKIIWYYLRLIRRMVKHSLKYNW